MPSAPEWTLASLFEAVGTTNKVAVEIGGAAPSVSAELGPGWKAIRIDRRAEPGVIQAVVTPSNVAGLVIEVGAPHEPDIFSIDVDGNDYHIWKRLTLRPRVVHIEYNAVAPPSWVTPFKADHIWDGTDWFGASLESLMRLGERLGYVCVGCDGQGANAFFLRADVAAKLFWRDLRPPLPRSPKWGTLDKRTR